MDTAFITGMSAFVSALIVFVGSAFLLLALVVGGRLAYFITASIALAFTFIMAVVWSINPLGPLGQAPEWEPIDAQEEATALDFDQAGSYPDDPWAEVDTEDATQATQASELESAATEHVSVEVSEGKIEGFPSLAQYRVTEDSTRLFEEDDGTLFGVTMIDVLPPIVQPELGIPSEAQQEEDAEAAAEATGAEEIEPLGQVAVVAEYDPGNPLGVARMLAGGTFILLVLHLFGLSMAERRVKRERAAAAA